MPCTPSRWLTILLVIAIAVVGIAVFSPLHKHDRQSKTKCSLGNIDAQQCDGVLVFWELPQLQQSIAAIPVATHIGIATARPLELPARAPPVSI